MSLEINVYTKNLTDDLIPRLISRLNKFEMNCETQPDFSFERRSGNLFFKFKLINSPIKKIAGKELFCEFELYYSSFDFSKSRPKEKTSWFSNWIKKAFSKQYKQKAWVNDAIDEKLMSCTTILTIVWPARDFFQLRFAELTSSILAELTEGVVNYPADNFWVTNHTEKAWEEVGKFERNEEAQLMIPIHEFQGWSFQN
jgi:hypothetical protein